MNWINNVVRPKIRGFLTTKREVPDKLWAKCPESGQMVFTKDLEANLFVYPGSGYHERMTAQARLASLFDGGAYDVIKAPPVPVDPLKFRDSRRYTDRLKDARAETGLDDSVLVGEGRLEGRALVAASHDMRFVGGSLGIAAGESVIAGMLRAVERNAPFVLFAASGGARMQEGILSLMQMPRTTIAVQRLREAKLPYIVVLTNPTTGGVTASYAMLGDVHIAEPGALICFAGPRVIQQTIREQLPDGFQRAEYLLDHGMVDLVVHRHQMRETLARLCRIMTRPTAKAASQDQDQDAPTVNGHPSLNGSGHGTALTLATAEAPASSEPQAIEPEPVADNDRFDAGKSNGQAAAPAEIQHGEVDQPGQPTSKGEPPTT